MPLMPENETREGEDTQESENGKMKDKIDEEPNVTLVRQQIYLYSQFRSE